MISAKAPNASAISRVLRSAGLGVVATRKREGLLVTRSLNRVYVTAQFDASLEAARRATEAAETLRGLGYAVEQDGSVLYVSAKAEKEFAQCELVKS